MGDVGLLSMLQGQDAWGERRAAKARDLQYASLMNQMSEQKLQQQQLAGQQMQEYMNTIGKLKLMDVAHNRATEVNDQLVVPIEEGLRAAGGDVRKFMLSGGINQLQKYKDQLINNPTIQKDLMSAYNVNRYNTDVKAGLTPRGNAGEDYQKYSKGDADYFGYGGGYESPNLEGIGKYFGETFGADKYTQQYAGPQDVYLYAEHQAKTKGMSPADVKHFATLKTNEYIQAVNAGHAQPYMFKSLDPSIKLQNEARAKYFNSKIASGSAAQGKTFYKTWIDPTAGIKPDATESTDWNGEASTIGRVPISVKQMDAILGGHGLLSDKGKIANPESIIQQNALFTSDGRPIDLGAINASQLEVTPLPWLVDVNSNDKPSVAARNNNPGNLIFVGQKGATPTEKGFKDDTGREYKYAKFATREDGINALKNQISIDARRGETLLDFVKGYAPKDKAAGNDPQKYFEFVSKKLGVSGNPKIADIDVNALSDAIMAQEGQGTPGQNKMKGMAFTIRIPESAAARVKVGKEDLDGWFTHANARGMKKDRHWFDENGYTMQVFMSASTSPGVMTQIEDAEGGLQKRQMQDFSGSLEMMDAMDLQRALNQIDEDAQ